MAYGRGDGVMGGLAMEMGIELWQDLETWQLIAGGVVIAGGLVALLLAIQNIIAVLQRKQRNNANALMGWVNWFLLFTVACALAGAILFVV